jgi:hypothetical protein
MQRHRRAVAARVGLGDRGGGGGNIGSIHTGRGAFHGRTTVSSIGPRRPVQPCGERRVRDRIPNPPCYGAELPPDPLATGNDLVGASICHALIRNAWRAVSMTARWFGCSSWPPMLSSNKAQGSTMSVRMPDISSRVASPQNGTYIEE